ncbi:CHRD domain-containing protein [Pseudoduganella violaceinigra]|uniref:CHRD domain-containing protein n=1 Tax=Pseudoduganella violaceinigra TaxID=246602 RepID=UPI000415A59B|nr:CHRD domain-containing protein [Pseudoduganella violaceinigra]
MKTHLGKGLAALALLAACATAQADPLSYSATLSGTAENPPNASAATGHVSVLFDLDHHYFTIAASFSDLAGGSAAAHIHCCTAVPGEGNAGVATMLPTFTGFPAGETSGSYAAFFDTSQAAFWNPSFVTSHGGTTAGAEAALAAALDAGSSYFNIHSDAYPGGEIRGFLAAPIPEPAQAAMLLAGLPLLLFLRRRRD